MTLSEESKRRIEEKILASIVEGIPNSETSKAEIILRSANTVLNEREKRRKNRSDTKWETRV